MNAFGHVPVMLDQVVEQLALRDGSVVVDGTVGLGGYSRALLEASGCSVIGIDRDPDAVARASELARRFPGRMSVVRGRFGDMVEIASAAGIDGVDGVVLDLGVSSMQIDDPDRGFSFRFDGPLDMRMERAGPTAGELINMLPEDELADIIHDLGEERLARRVARAMVAARADRPFTRTAELADVVRRVVPKSRDGIDPATRTFQALRIFLNDELGELDRGLRAAEMLLRPGGRLVVVSFHSLEDRRVKAFLRTRSGHEPRPSRHLPNGHVARPLPTFAMMHRSGFKANDAETAANPRARSARLRVGERTAAPAWTGGDA